MEMNHGVFRKLQDALEYPCRSKHWFGMAEQAINTIYALGEHPDELCGKIIQNLTLRVFASGPQPLSSPQKVVNLDETADHIKPVSYSGDVSCIPISKMTSPMRSASQSNGNPAEKDVGDAFQLGQLLFVVGHVAIKHIVFLELVEREWKRQKDEKELGGSHQFNSRCVNIHCRID